MDSAKDMQRPVILDRACITIEAIHTRRMLQEEEQKSQLLAPTGQGMFDSQGGETQQLSSHPTAPPPHCTLPQSSAAEKVAVMAMACKQVALNGFEPVENALSLHKW
jgi:hypothetical protein